MLRKGFLSLAAAAGLAMSGPALAVDYSKAGGLDITEEENLGPGRDYTVIAPAGLKGGEGLPVIVWGNATGSPTGLYKPILEHLASHGFIVVAGDDSFTGDGDSMIEGLDWILDDSEYADSIDSSAVGITGHSQGGASAVVVAATDSRIKALVAIQPDCNFWVDCDDAEDINAATLAIAGSSDILVSSRSVKRKVYDEIGRDIPAVFAERRSMGHMGWFSDQVDTYGDIIGSWFGAHLKGDSAALDDFASNGKLAGDREWSEFESKGL